MPVRKEKVDSSQLDFLSPTEANQFLDLKALEARYPNFETMIADQGDNSGANEAETIIKPIRSVKRAVTKLEKNLEKKGGDKAWLIGHH